MQLEVLVGTCTHMQSACIYYSPMHKMCTMPQAGHHMACMMFANSCFSPSLFNHFFYSVLIGLLKSLARTSYNMCDNTEAEPIYMRTS